MLLYDMVELCSNMALIENFLEIFNVKKKEDRCSIDMKLRCGKRTLSEVLRQNSGNNKQIEPKKIITREIGVPENKTMGNSLDNPTNISSRKNQSKSALCEMKSVTLSSTPTKNTSKYVSKSRVCSTNILRKSSSNSNNNTNCIGDHSSQPPQSFSTKKTAAQDVTPLIVDSTNIRTSLKSNNNTNCLFNHSSLPPQSFSTKKSAAQDMTPLIVDSTNIRSSLKSKNTNCIGNHSSQPPQTTKKTAEHNVTPLIVDGTNIRTEKAKKKRKTCSVIDSIFDQGTENEIVQEIVSNSLTDTSQSKKRKRSSVDEISKDTELEKSSNFVDATKVDDDVCSVISLGSDEEVMILDSASKFDLDVSSDIVILDTPCPKKKKPNPDAEFIDLATPAQMYKSSEFLKLKPKRKKTRRLKPNYNYKSSFKQYESVLGNNTFQRNTIFTAPPSTSTYMNSISSGSASCQTLIASNPGVVNNRSHTQVISSSVYGNNFYNPNPNSIRTGLRPVVIDGSNVAMGHTNGRIFSSLGLKICIDYFVLRNHKVIAFVPQFRKGCCTNLKMLEDLEKQGYVTFTPSRKIRDRLVVPYDDRYIVQYAAQCGGVIVSTDNYRDLLLENPTWRDTIENRLLMFTWVEDVLMFPQDPLGRSGPNLERFLKFP